VFIRCTDYEAGEIHIAAEHIISVIPDSELGGCFIETTGEKRAVKENALLVIQHATAARLRLVTG
jgi:hypothetical protein